MDITLNPDGSLTISGAFSISGPDFTVKALDGSSINVTNLAALQTENTALHAKISKAIADLS